MTAEIYIDGRRISRNDPPYIVAELSANHNGTLERAFRLLEAAAKSGVDAVKIQTYRPDTITLPSNGPEFQIQGGLWRGRTLYELYEEAHTPWEWHEPLFRRARELGVTLFSSPFDQSAVDLLESLGAPAYKIASFEAVDLPLIRYAARTGKPLIISTGMANAEEIGETVEAAQQSGCRELMLLHCVSGYPAPPEDYNLRTLVDMANRFGVPTGLSDHTVDNATAIAATALGACFIEKHVTLDRRGGGPDDSFSLEPEDLVALCRDANTAWQALGRVSYQRAGSEKGNVQFRRSLYFIKDMKAGETIDESCVRSVRPGYGLPPKYLDSILGRTLSQDVPRHTPVRWNCLNGGDIPDLDK